MRNESWGEEVFSAETVTAQTAAVMYYTPTPGLAYWDLPVIVLIVFTNTLNIAAVIKAPALRKTPYHHLLLSLSCADLLMALSLIANFVGKVADIYTTGTLTFLRFQLLVESAPMKVSLSVALYNLLLVGVDRCVAVIRPLRYKELMQVGRVQLLIVVGWLFFSLVALCVTSYFVSQLPEDIVRSNPHFSHMFPPVVYMSIDVGPAYCFLIVIAIIYTVLIIAFIKKKTNVNKTMSQSAARDVSRRKKILRVTRLSLLLVFVLFLCYIPYTVFSFIIPHAELWHHVVIERLTINILWSSSFWNPILYAWQMADFRNVYIQILTCK